MSSIAPVIFIVLVWLLIGLPIAKVKNAVKQQNTAAQKPFPKETSDEAAAETRPVPAPPSVRPSVQPYTGSLGPATGGSLGDPGSGSLDYASNEGIDICHTEQSHAMDLAEAEDSLSGAYGQEPQTLPFLNGKAIVNGFVMSEILNRKTR